MSSGVREADDWAAVGRLLHAFNTEYDEPSPPPEVLAERLPTLADARVLVVGDPPHGLAVLRFRPAIWADAPECYLAELYIAPDHRGRGDGRALLDAAVELARAEGAAWIDLNTSTDDTAARGLYTSAGFSNTEGKPDGASQLYYEREL